MNARRLLRLLLAVLVTAGLTVAPLATPAAAGHSMGAMQMADAQDMPDDMACCPDKQNNKQCQDCPLIAICMLKVLQTGPSAATVSIRQPVRELLRPLDDMIADGLTRPPPDQPPRSIV
ncbi:hypothetical protein IVB15_01640 [Bradyrhizobium sp. 182]|uniref:hypothetical protein n=1 Tax=unclassified Bradyrhizobium TaxID=2631580 RepID=UPI001FFA3A1B|nr:MULTISPECIES: hypothetical protein [unclassified Bradyrhizobium]MCK1526480.1 hypothetical protein [Bradyrhizobium sp. 182]MCK1618891.1 hypothetical protein [Bradyrhizobium sp. 159]MCK1667291.1 hypothetical protein [Bradyrhizobium sp. 153]MCK1755755.1 hypothetical protein [Bradyrhizobium sp. 137]